MLHLFLVRHGETLSNKWHTLQGWSDTPLTKNGIEQGKNLGSGLFNIPFLKIYTSTSERAYDTACCVRGNRNIEINMCKGLKEMNFGMLETKSNVFEGGETYTKRLNYPYRNVMGENLEDVCSRMKKTLLNIVNDNHSQNGNILCVSHGIAILAALHMVDVNKFQRCISEEIRFGNCSVTVISWNNGLFKIEDINNLEYEKKGRKDEEDNQ